MTDKFNNLSDEALADEIGELNAIIKGHEDRLDALKDAFKDRARSIVKGQSWIVSASTSTGASAGLIFLYCGLLRRSLGMSARAALMAACTAATFSRNASGVGAHTRSK